MTYYPDTQGPGNLTPEVVTALQTLTTRLRLLAEESNHRRTLVLAGDAAWTLAAADASLNAPAPHQARVTPEYEGKGTVTKDFPLEGRGGLGAPRLETTRRQETWISDRTLERPHYALASAAGLLGSETDTLVYDTYGGFDPDGFGAAVGALRGGGLLLLLTPALDEWAERPDPQCARVAIYPFTHDQVSGRFLKRITRVLSDAVGVTIVQQGHPTPALPPGPDAAWRDASTAHPGAAAYNSHQDAQLTIARDCRTLDQSAAVEAIRHTARMRARRPLIITSDRGRGKSSALGIAAARLLADTQGRILVTAPRRSAVDALFQHACRLLPGALAGTNRIDHDGGVLEFRPPDKLCLSPCPADLLLVDEAAGIPAPLLECLLKSYARAVFATTIHGYEGTGRGFEVRFRRTLDRVTPNWRELELQTPIRWAPGDPLEALTARTLLLGATPAPDAELADADPENCRHDRLDRDALQTDEATLSQLFGLLVLAHYQTRPLDLRHLLDGPNIRIHVLRQGIEVAATALVALEGNLAPDISRKVFEGLRRPRGHLLAQTLCAHGGLEEAPRLRYARIVRIAVHPAAQGRGLGRMLLDHIFVASAEEGLDMVGASFGATEELLRFWMHCQFPPAHMGTRRNAASGAYAAIVLRPSSPTGEALQGRAQLLLRTRLPTLLAGPLRDLEPDISTLLLASTATNAGPVSPPPDWRELEAFAFAQRPFEAALPPIDGLLRAHLGAALRDRVLDQRQGTSLIAKIFQHRDWSATAGMVGVPGRSQVVALLRAGVGRLIQCYGPRR